MTGELIQTFQSSSGPFGWCAVTVGDNVAISHPWRPLDGELYAGVVHVFDTAMTTKTDVDGNYSFTGLDTGT